MTDKKTSKRKAQAKKRGKAGPTRTEPHAKNSATLGRPRMDPVGVLGQRIHELAMSRFGSRSKLARAAGLVPSRLSETIRGITTPQMSTLARIAEACEITLSELLSETPLAVSPST